MENKCLYIRPNNKGVFDMNLICNIDQTVNKYTSHTETYYDITFNNRTGLRITPEEYEDLLEAMTDEYSFYEGGINDGSEDESDNEESNEDYDGYAVTSHDVKTNDYNEEYEEYSESENKGLFGFCNKINW